MQEIINAMLRAILQDANQQKPIAYSVKRWNDLFVEFHSWFLFEFVDWYITITNWETQEKTRIRYWVNAKLSKKDLDMIKEWLNRDFNSWIVIEDDTEEDNESTEEKDNDEGTAWDNDWWESWDWAEWEWEEVDKTSGEKEKASQPAKAQSTKKLPWWAAAKK